VVMASNTKETFKSLLWLVAKTYSSPLYDGTWQIDILIIVLFPNGMKTRKYGERLVIHVTLCYLKWDHAVLG
jgi:hypothetical protein